jgi:hypothetical protein
MRLHDLQPAPSAKIRFADSSAAFPSSARGKVFTFAGCACCVIAGILAIALMCAPDPYSGFLDDYSNAGTIFFCLGQMLMIEGVHAGRPENPVELARWHERHDQYAVLRPILHGMLFLVVVSALVHEGLKFS